jgi:hypothetical protein
LYIAEDGTIYYKHFKSNFNKIFDIEFSGYVSYNSCRMYGPEEISNDGEEYYYTIEAKRMGKQKFTK